MPEKQSWNPRIGAYVKYEFGKDGINWDVKERNPSKPFKGVPIVKKKNGK